MGKILVSLVAFLLLLSSCSKGEDWASIYEGGDWRRLVEASASALDEGIESEALYYRMMALYRLGEYSEACDCAVLFTLMYSNDEKWADQCHDADLILLYYSGDPRLEAEAGLRIRGEGRAGTGELVALFSALTALDDWENAAAVYNEVRPRLSARTASLMCIASKASSTIICPNLEAWMSEEGYSDELRLAIMAASRLLLSRGEASLILPLALTAYVSGEAGDGEMAIVIGDIYVQMEMLGEARTYYTYAYQSLPDMAIERLRAIQGR